MPLTYDDEPGSWGRHSVGWPETPYSVSKWLLCSRAMVVPYGSYVRVDDVIRIETQALKEHLEKAHQGLFGDCRALLIEELGPARKVTGDQVYDGLEIAGQGNLDGLALQGGRIFIQGDFDLAAFLKAINFG